MFSVPIDGAGLDKDGWADGTGLSAEILGLSDSGAFVGACVGLGDEGDSLL